MKNIEYPMSSYQYSFGYLSYILPGINSELIPCISLMPMIENKSGNLCRKYSFEIFLITSIICPVFQIVVL